MLPQARSARHTAVRMAAMRLRFPAVVPRASKLRPWPFGLAPTSDPPTAAD
jgi:hypothetical protein